MFKKERNVKIPRYLLDISGNRVILLTEFDLTNLCPEPIFHQAQVVGCRDICRVSWDSS